MDGSEHLFRYHSDMISTLNEKDLTVDFADLRTQTVTTLTIGASFSYAGTDCGTTMTLIETVEIGSTAFTANAIYIDYQSLSPSVYYPITYSYFLFTLASVTSYGPTIYVVLHHQNLY